MGLPSNTQAVWSETLLDALIASGVRHVVLSPGSRSTPLVLALARPSELRVHDVVDERAAGFFALGVARATGAPAALVCTSGSAPFHYAPAVAEADVAGLPLVVVSANRPFALERSGESQTLDQTRMFGDRVRCDFDLGEPLADDHALRSLRRRVAFAVHRASHPLPGPVHLDVRFVKPLEPDEATVDAVAHRARASEVLRERAPRFEVGAAVPEFAIDRFAAEFASARRPLLLFGPAHAPASDVADGAAELAARGVPVVVDVASQLRFHRRAGAFRASLDWLARAGDAAPEPPDLVVQFGRAPVATSSEPYFARARRVLVDAHDYLDPTSRADTVFVCPPRVFVGRVAAHLAARGVTFAHGAAWEDFERRVRSAVAHASERSPSREVDAALAALDAVPDGGRLVLGNSLPIRHLDTFAGTRDRNVEVHSQRGASGIDGFVAALVGAQRSAPKPTVLLLGDVTLAHDLGSLALLRGVDAPTAVVVLDNAGGRIFDRLPIAAHAGAPLDRYRMAPVLDVAAIATAFGIEARGIDDASEVRESLRDLGARRGPVLLHVKLDASAGAALLAEATATLRASRASSS